MEYVVGQQLPGITLAQEKSKTQQYPGITGGKNDLRRNNDPGLH